MSLIEAVELTMHDLDDIEEICQRLVIIDRGRKIFDGDLQTVRDRFARERAIGLLLRSSSESPTRTPASPQHCAA